MLERRRHKRFKCTSDTFVFSKMPPGRIKDISMGGMAFSHVYNGDDCQSIDCLSLFDKENNFFLEDVSCRTVANDVVDNKFPFSVMPTVKKSIEFSLSASQADQLRQYIQAYASGCI